ncbi:MAG: hypothetical protein A2X46_16520 [Lentisphaerae bacterium GWF2_57_35]|nr:MAG: hypothetical protein A2X46_16520 [Lentisphaerae bacterium GWF2_57_35]
MVTAYALPWHLKESSAFHEILVQPLTNYGHVALQALPDGQIPAASGSDEAVVFCQVVPPWQDAEWRKRKVVWIPMWDHISAWPDARWSELPKTWRIAAFSEPVFDRARRAGLPVLRLQYFKDISGLPESSWQDGISVMYWNRVGMVRPNFLRRLCEVLNAKNLYFRDEVDPGYGKARYFDLPSQLGSTRVQRFPYTANRQQYEEQWSCINVLVAPRPLEGMGLLTVEALARGCAVLAFNAPTMNEYIQHGQNGYLLDSLRARWAGMSTTCFNRWWLDKCVPREKSRRRKALQGSLGLLTVVQDWQALRRLDLKQMGACARVSHGMGYQRWQQSIPLYADFVLRSDVA